MNGYAKFAIGCFTVGLLVLAWMGASFASDNWSRWFPPFSCPAGQTADSSESECFVQPACNGGSGQFVLDSDNETCVLSENACHPNGAHCPGWLTAVYVTSECCETWWAEQVTVRVNATLDYMSFNVDCSYFEGRVGMNMTLHQDWLGRWEPSMALPGGCEMEW